MAEKEYIERDEAVRKAIDACIKVVGHGITQFDAVDIADEIDAIPSADVVEVDKVAEMLRLSFGDDCACNFNGNDEWMWEKCKYAETDCPYPKEDNGCWKEFVKHFIAKMDGKGEGE